MHSVANRPRKRYLGFSGAIILALSCAPALGDVVRPPAVTYLSEAELRSLMIGRPMAGVYPEGTPWRETIMADGTADYAENAKRKPGRWWFEQDGYLCFNYPSEGTGGCFKYVKLTANCYEHFSKPRLGTDDGLPNPMMSNGKLWRDDQPSTCEAEPSV